MVSSNNYKAGLVCLAVVAIALGIGIGIGTKKTDHQNEALSSMKASEVIDVDAAYDIDCENRRLVLIVPGVGDYQVEGTSFNRRRLVRRLGTEADIPPQPENSRPGAGGWYPEVDCKHNKCTSASNKSSGGSSEYSVASSKSSKANGKSNKSSKKSSKTSKSKKKCISKKTKSDKCPSKKTTKSESSTDDIPYGRDLGTEATVSPVFQPFRPEPTQAPTLVDEVDTESPDTDSPTQSPRVTTSPPTNKPGSDSGSSSKTGKYSKKSKSSKTWGHAPTTCRSSSVGTPKPTIDRPIVPAATPFPSFSPTFGSPPLFNTETNAPTAEPPITTTPTVDLPLVPASTSFPITPFPSYSPTYGGSQTGTPPLFNTKTNAPTLFVEINTEPPDTDSPTQSPSVKPTTTPPTPVPTPEPTTPAPTTEAPVTPFPTPVPTTSSPTLAPSDKPTTNVPTISPSLAVTDSGTTTVATDVSSPPTNPPRDRFKL